MQRLTWQHAGELGDSPAVGATACTGYTHIDADAAAATEVREQAEEERKDVLRVAIAAFLSKHTPTAFTREQIWDGLQPWVRKNDKRFKSVMEAENGRLWVKSGSGGKSDPYRYRRLELVTHPGEEEGGEG